MSGQRESIQQLYNRLQQLLKQYQQLQKDHQRLQGVLAELQEEKLQAAEQMERLSLQVDVLKSAAGQMNEEDKKQFAKKLGRYIKDIDHCITLLSE